MEVRGKKGGASPQLHGLDLILGGEPESVRAFWLVDGRLIQGDIIVVGVVGFCEIVVVGEG